MPSMSFSHDGHSYFIAFPVTVHNFTRTLSNIYREKETFYPVFKCSYKYDITCFPLYNLLKSKFHANTQYKHINMISVNSVT